MHTYHLPNGCSIDFERLVEAALREDEYPQTYLDLQIGVLVEIPAKDNLKAWVSEIADSRRYVLLEPLTDEERVQYALAFIELFLVDDVPKPQVDELKNLLHTSGGEAFERALVTETDGWIHVWDQYIHDAAGEYVHAWLTENPHTQITATFTGCGDCAICQAMRDGTADSLPDLLTAFETEAVMQSVESQLTSDAPVAPRTTVNAELAATAFVFKVSLQGSKPLIWRRIVLSATATFYELHVAIQDALGWEDYHLHAFTVDKRAKQTDKKRPRSESMVQIKLPDSDDPLFGPAHADAADERRELLGNWFDTVTKQCVYTYDFGDGWAHTVLLEKTEPINPQATYPQCLAGKNACPPEDCGGIRGYDYLQEILRDPTHAEHHDMLEWLDIDSAKEFDASHFKPSEVVFADPAKRLRAFEQNMGVAPLQ